MKSDPTPQRELSAQEISRVVDWIDGNLSQQDALEFERDLSGDPLLAQKVEAFAQLDSLVRLEARAREQQTRTRPRWGMWVGLAAAAVLVIAIGSRFFSSDAPRCEVALAPGFALAEDWTQELPELQGASAPGIGVSRGPNSKPLTAEEFLRRAERAEASAISDALAKKRSSLEAGWFVVPIELSAPASVVVLGFASNAPAARLFPSPDAVGASNAGSRLEAGRHLLPSTRAVPGTVPQTLDYRPGFLVPLGAKEFTVLVGARKQPLNASDLAELDGWVASERSVDSAAARLEAAGFRVQRLLVREPQ